jgi:hypothetical protein
MIDEYLLNYPQLSGYLYLPLLSLFIAFSPILFFLFSLSFRDVPSRKLLSLLFILLTCAGAFFKRGGADSTYYTLLFKEDILLYYAEPFWRIYYALYEALVQLFDKEIILSMSLSAILFMFYYPFLIVSDEKVLLPSLLLSYSLFAYALPLAQVRMSLSITFLALSIFFYSYRRIANICYLFIALTLISHTTAIGIIPLAYFMIGVKYEDLKNAFRNMKFRKKVITIFIFAVFLVSLGVYYLSARYSFVGENSAISVGSAGSSLEKDLLLSLLTLAPLCFTITGASRIKLRNIKVAVFDRTPYGAQLFNYIFIPLSFLGWLARLRFWGLYSYIYTISKTYSPSGLICFIIITLASIRNCYLVLYIDPGFSFFNVI